MTDHYRHAGPSQHPARDLADGATLGLKVMAVLFFGTVILAALFWVNAGLEFYIAALLGIGALLVGLFERQQRATSTDMPAVEEVEQP